MDFSNFKEEFKNSYIFTDMWGIATLLGFLASMVTFVGLIFLSLLLFGGIVSTFVWLIT